MAYTSEVVVSFLSGLKPRPIVEALFSNLCIRARLYRLLKKGFFQVGPGFSPDI